MRKARPRPRLPPLSSQTSEPLMRKWSTAYGRDHSVSDESVTAYDRIELMTAFAHHKAVRGDARRGEDDPLGKLCDLRIEVEASAVPTLRRHHVFEARSASEPVLDELLTHHLPRRFLREAEPHSDLDA